MAQLFLNYPIFAKPEKIPPPRFDDDALHRAVNDNKSNSMFILTDSKGKKLRMGTYWDCDWAWTQLLDQKHYTDAGIIWFLFEGQAYKMPGY
jgi:hypothetical protein